MTLKVAQFVLFPDSTSKIFLDLGFHKQKFYGFWNPDSLTIHGAKTC